MNKIFPGQVYVVSAPSGAGKTTLTKKLIESMDRCVLSVSYTTRDPRPDEKEGEDYFFITPNEFKAMIQRDELLEHAEVFGHFYGTAKEQVIRSCQKGMDIILDIDVQGARQIQKKLKTIRSIFILPPSLAILRDRLISRGTENPQNLEARLLHAENEMKACIDYDYIIVNDEFESAANLLKSIVCSERCITERVLQSGLSLQSKELLIKIGAIAND